MGSRLNSGGGGGGGGGSGTVTSVALTVPAELSVSGSPVTSAGTLAVTKAAASANRVYAGPSSGAAAQPTMRALVAADVGAVNPSALTGSGTVPSAGLPAATTGALGAIQVGPGLAVDGSGVLSTSVAAVHAYNSADSTAASATVAILGMDSTRFDQGTASAQHSTSTQTSRLVCQQAGIYLILGEVQYDASGAGSLRQCRLHLNGALLMYRLVAPVSTAYTPVAASALWPLSAGDYVELGVYHDAGSPLIVRANGNTPLLAMVRLC